MLVSTLDHSSYVGRIAIGRIERGRVSGRGPGRAPPLRRSRHGARIEAIRSKVTKLFSFQGLDRVEVQSAEAGDIVALSGLEGVEIGQTLTHPEHRERLRGIQVEEPTLSVDFTVNNSPFAARSGSS
jgi:GTP-binding protein